MLVIGADMAVEMMLGQKWNRKYFAWGFSLFKREFLLSGGASRGLDLDLLRERFGNSRWVPFKFHKLTENEYGLLPGAGRGVRTTALTAVPFLRGHMVIDGATGTASFRGRLNWFSIVFPTGFFYIFLNIWSQSTPAESDISNFVWLIVAWNVGWLAISCVAQFRRFAKIAEYLQNEYRT
jgi:hypothetical protein